MVPKLFILLFLTYGPKISYETVENVNVESPKDLKALVSRSCKEIQNSGVNISGVYRIQPKLAPKPFDAFCDMETRGGGWTYLLNRFNGFQNFYLDWKNYKNGFGNLLGEFWLGLDNLHYLTNSEDNELLVELFDWDQKEAYALYKSFKVGDESGGYILSVTNHSGNAGDSFSSLSGERFSTYDKDHDIWSKNCAASCKAAWWYRMCASSQLTGQYLEKGTEIFACKGILWAHFRGLSYSLKKARMMVRPSQEEIQPTV